MPKTQEVNDLEMNVELFLLEMREGFGDQLASNVRLTPTWGNGNTTTTVTWTIPTMTIGGNCTLSLSNLPYQVPEAQEKHMKSSVVALPEGHVGVVSAVTDGIDIPVAKTKAYPFDVGNGSSGQPSTWRSYKKALDAAQKLTFKLTQKMGK